MFPKLPVVLRRKFKQSRKNPEDDDVLQFSSVLSDPSLSGLVFARLPSADSASSIIIMPPRRLLLAHVTSLRNSAGPWELKYMIEWNNMFKKQVPYWAHWKYICSSHQGIWQNCYGSCIALATILLSWIKTLRRGKQTPFTSRGYNLHNYVHSFLDFCRGRTILFIAWAFLADRLACALKLQYSRTSRGAVTAKHRCTQCNHFLHRRDRN